LKSGTSVASVNDVSETVEWSVSPNPANDGTLLKWSVPTTGLISVINSLGQTVNRVDISDETKAYYLDLKPLEAGVYWIDFSSDKGDHMRKLVVKN